MSVVTLNLGEHVAHLDPMSGIGLLVLPDPSADVWLGPVSIHAASWNDAVRSLARHGYEVLLDDWDMPAEEGLTADGRAAVGIGSTEPGTG